MEAGRRRRSHRSQHLQLPSDFFSQRFQRQVARSRPSLLPFLQCAPRDFEFQRGFRLRKFVSLSPGRECEREFALGTASWFDESAHENFPPCGRHIRESRIALLASVAKCLMRRICLRSSGRAGDCRSLHATCGHDRLPASHRISD